MGGLGGLKVGGPDEPAALRPIVDNLHRCVVISERRAVERAVDHPAAAVIDVDDPLVQDRTAAEADRARVTVERCRRQNRGKEPVGLAHLPQGVPRRVCAHGNRRLDVNGSHTLIYCRRCGSRA
jgi:hypothetical protein